MESSPLHGNDSAGIPYLSSQHDFYIDPDATDGQCFHAPDPGGRPFTIEQLYELRREVQQCNGDPRMRKLAEEAISGALVISSWSQNPPLMDNQVYAIIRDLTAEAANANRSDTGVASVTPLRPYTNNPAGSSEIISYGTSVNRLPGSLPA